MNIFTIRNFIIILCIGICSTNVYAQNWAIKPFIGGHYNIVDLSQDDARNLAYSASSINHHPIRPTYGLIVSYQFNPKWGVEIGYKRNFISIWADYTHPFTGASLGSYNMAAKRRSLMFNANYAFYDNQKGLRLKALAGIEIQNAKNGGLNSLDEKTVYSTDTNFTVMPDQNHRFLTYVNLGISAEFLIKRKPIAELRMTSGIGYRYNCSIQTKLDYNGYSYNNTHSTTGTYLNAILVLNLNTLFGKWKD